MIFCQILSYYHSRLLFLIPYLRTTYTGGAAIIFLLVGLFSQAAWAESGYSEKSGELDGVLYDIAIADEWNGKLLLFNHGLIFEHLPLSTYMEPIREPFRTLLQEGWMVAASSYRRNGMVVNDAAEDVLILHSFLVRKYGPPKRTLLMGESMGGAVSLRLIESLPGRFHGAAILGAGLMSSDPGTKSNHSYQPESPVLFMSNQSEIDQATDYYSQSRKNGKNTALWQISRDGHINFNEAEFLASVKALDNWVETGYIKREKDATVFVEGENSTARFADGGAYGKILDINTTFGNMTVDFTASDFNRLGVALGQNLVLKLKGKEFTATRAKTFSDVPVGQWVVFEDAEGRHTIAINRSHAANEAGVKKGDPVFIKAKNK